MTKKDRAAIEKWAEELSDDELEAAYYRAVLDCLGSQTEEMYELGYDIADIEEQDKLEQYRCDEADVIEEICQRRGIKLWNDSEAESSPFIQEDLDDPVYIHKPESVISGWDYSDLIEEAEDRIEERRAIYGNEII